MSTTTWTKVTFANPYLRCDTCGLPVTAMRSDTNANLPCSAKLAKGAHFGVESACPSWSPVTGCGCLPRCRLPLDFSLTWKEAVAAHEPGARLIITDGKGYAAVHIPWSNFCGAHDTEREYCRCGFPDGKPIGNHSRNGLRPADWAWISR